MAKPATRIAALQALLVLAGAGLFGRAFYVQVVQHGAWARKAEQLRTESDSVPARRGSIRDRFGAVLAVTQEAYRITIAPDQLEHRERVIALLERLPGLSRERVAKAFTKPYPNFYDEFSAEDVEALRTERGVHLTPVRQRAYPLNAVAKPLLGGLDDQGRATAGLERVLDTLLTGVPGQVRYVRDSRGTRVDVPSSQLRAPVPGADVHLTLDAELQGIAEAELRRAVDGFQARGGDVVILQIATGEILAAASIRTDSARGQLRATPAVLVESYEPGSTAKIFTAAAMLAYGADTGAVSGEGGAWEMPYATGKTRHIEDVHRVDGMMTLGGAIQVSSNIAMSKYSVRLRPEQQFTVLRDFGFGTGPAIGFPGEDAGWLRRPALWENDILSQASLGQGYEFRTTAIQMAAAYGAIANGGRLLAPTLVRAVQPAGAIDPTWTASPAVLRQAIPDSVARTLVRYLALATDSAGTGQLAQLDRFTVVGKTGTAKILVDGRYTMGSYRASFAGLFPGDAPQWVVYVMIDRPRGAAYYGGLVAAPMVRTMLQQALATRQSALDRGRLDAVVRRAPTPDATPVGAGSGAPLRRVAWPLPAAPATPPAAIPVPALAGVSLREGIRDLHRLGFVVRIVGRPVGLIRATAPAAGDSLRAGASITIYADSTR